MPDVTKTIDGNFSADELKQTLVAQEQLGFVRLAGITAGNQSPPVNNATFKDDPDPNPPPEIIMVPIGAAQDVNAVVAAQQAAGHQLLFTSTIFVSGARTAVSFFR